MDAPWLAAACSQLESRRLFYPSAGSDILVPICEFTPYIDEFWFSDVSYTIDKPLLEHADYHRDSTTRSQLSGLTLRRSLPFRIQVSSERYIHVPTGRVFVANACCGRGYDCFRAAFKEPAKLLSVFFYRGDSQGDGGSGFSWLRRPIIKYVFAQLDRHAIIVSDGSNAMAKLSKFHRDSAIGSDAVRKCESFDVCGRHLKCIGYVGDRYGPTLVWSVDSAEASNQPERRRRSGIG